ncbi:hypothetical protein KEJ50_03170 [Candidatus Bathyarchaeota archaeon]|nr:hypothetical protein [Candidatus Bathyarchaeota archaeon]
MSEENEENDKEIIIKLAKTLVKLDESSEENIEEERKCSCGNTVSTNAKYCDKCGRKLTLKEKPKVIIKKIQLI